MDSDYHLINSNRVSSRPRFISKIKRNKKKISLLLLVLTIVGTATYYFYFKDWTDDKKILIKGEPRIDKYGIDLNQYILDGIYSIGFDNYSKKKLENSKLYVPPCPDLEPVQYPDSIKNPVCEETSLQFGNLHYKKGGGLPYSLPMHDITTLMDKWKEWEKNHKEDDVPMYANKTMAEMTSDEYHPFDYGYTGPDTSDISDEEYYKKVINSRMDEVPDPRRRRLFFFILFNSEYNLLDLQLSEFYDVVDYFVIYEANSTFSGIPKPLYFTRAFLETNRYDKYKDKIIPLPLEIVVNDKIDLGKSFPRERVARRVLIEKGLRAVQARHGDIFIHGDLDEFPKPHVLYRMKKCGGWEHMQKGIGGGPKSFKTTDVKSYFKDESLNVEKDDRGSYKVDYDRVYSLGFMSWFFEYAFHIISDDKLPGITRPNISIFDARRSLGQLVDYNNRPDFKKRDLEEKEHVDLLSDPNFDPYEGYTYSDNTNYRFTGKGYIAENIRLSLASFYENVHYNDTALLWNGAWHLSTFLPNVDIIYNKVFSYSHNDHYEKMTEKEAKEVLKFRVKHHSFIHGSFDSFKDYDIVLPKSYNDGYKYNFNTDYWRTMIKNNGEDEEFKDYVNMLIHDIPTHVWKNPICYNYMLDRDYGLDKKLWYQYVPKRKWGEMKISNLKPSVIEKLLPVNITGTFREEYLAYLESQRDENEDPIFFLVLLFFLIFIVVYCIYYFTKKNNNNSKNKKNSRILP